MKPYKGFLPTLALFGSVSTLLCCALPALLVSIGAGAAVIGLVSTFPQLIWLSEHKIALFITAGILLTAAAVHLHQKRNAACPVDPLEARACLKLRRIGGGMFLLSVMIYLTGFYFAFLGQYF